MSTRAVIQFQGSNIHIYKHSDGYPDGPHGVLAWLRPMVDTFIRERGFDVSYMIARILTWYGVQEETDRLAALAEDPACFWAQKRSVLGLGVCSDVHMDAAYTYTIGPDGSIVVAD